MINIEWRTVAQGFDYKKYLQRQVQDVLEDAAAVDGKMGYYAEAGEFNEKNLTYIRGGIADRLGLTGPATMEKLAEISQAELGDHPLLDKRRKRDKITRTITHPDTGRSIQITQNDIKQGFVAYKDAQIPIDPSKIEESVVGNQRTSLEIIYSVDKSFSYLFFSNLLTPAQKKAMQQLFLDSVKEIQDSVVKKMIVDYVGQSGEIMEYAMMHLDNREQDPHIHAHVNMSNIIRLADGTIRVIEPRELFQRGCAERMDAQFKALFAKKFQEAFPDIPLESYDADFQEINPQFAAEVKDMRVAFDKATTKRIRGMYLVRQKIKDEIDREKKNLYELTQQKILELREQEQAGTLSKDEVLARVIEVNKDYEEKYSFMNSRRYDTQVKQRIKNKKRVTSLHEQQGQLIAKAEEMKLALKSINDAVLYRQMDKERIVEILTNRNPKFTRNDLIREFAKYMGLGVEAERIADKFLREHEDIFAMPRNPNEQPVFTLKSLARLEASNLSIFTGLTSYSHPRFDLAGYFEELEADGIRLKDEQKAFVQNVFNGNGASLVVGLPGTGKSFAMKYAVQFARAQSYRTIGLAPTGKVAAAVAADTNPDYAGTIDKFLLDLDSGKLNLSASDMIFVDEAGMVGTRHYNKLLRAVEAAGAKLVLVGDNNQLDPVAAGNTFNEFIMRHANKTYTTILSEISRQRIDEALNLASQVSGKATMDALEGSEAQKLNQWQDERKTGDHIRQAFDAMEACDFIAKHRTTKDMMEVVVGEFLANHEDYTEKILLASTNKTVDHLNERIQQQRQAEGQLGKALESSRGTFHVGDRVVVRKNNKEVKNGDLGSVVSVTHDGMIVVAFDSGKQKAIDPEQTDIGLGYAMTIHKSQGITKNTTIHVGEVSELNNSQSFNVAATRMRYQYKFHAVAADLEAIRNSYCRTSSKMSLMEIYALLEGEEDPSAGKRARLDWINSHRVPPMLTHEDVMEVMGIDLRKIQQIASELEDVRVQEPDLAELKKRMREIRYRNFKPKPVDVTEQIKPRKKPVI
ncbi:AAA family ATPase [Burkholderia vietnamiensis]|uniref:AAA family ATPase n=1 Tax=Burkholderia vietnamiensis TaxID=60552 RepID=UPI001589BD2C|nr:AAA family ATPase [Burkholderia vietnamiensis]